MKKSEYLQQAFNTEENDLKALGIGKQLIRETRKEKFEDFWLSKLKDKTSVIFEEQNGRYIFQIENKGIIDFYPKANKIHIRKTNKWIQPGLKWIIKHLKL